MNDDAILQQVAATAHSRHEGDLLYFVMKYRGRVDLPSYPAFLIRVREVLLTRHPAHHVEHVLRYSLPDEPPVKARNTGQIVYTSRQT